MKKISLLLCLAIFQACSTSGLEATSNDNVDSEEQTLSAYLDSTDSWLYEGDIILPKKMDTNKHGLSKSGAQVSYLLTDYYLPAGTIVSYQFYQGASSSFRFSEESKNEFRRVFADISNGINIKFKETSQLPTTGTRLLLKLVTGGNQNEMGVTSSKIGRANTENTLLVNKDKSSEFTYRNFYHQTLHFLGFYHEHQKMDRDQYVTIAPENNSDWNYTKSEGLASPVYDYSSIMHYKESASTLTTVQSGIVDYWTGNLPVASITDRLGLAKAYGSSTSMTMLYRIKNVGTGKYLCTSGTNVVLKSNEGFTECFFELAAATGSLFYNNVMRNEPGFNNSQVKFGTADASGKYGYITDAPNTESPHSLKLTYLSSPATAQQWVRFGTGYGNSELWNTSTNTCIYDDGQGVVSYTTCTPSIMVGRTSPTVPGLSSWTFIPVFNYNVAY